MSYKGRSLQAFNDSMTHPCGTKELSISIGEGRHKRMLKVFFLVVPGESTYNCILGRIFLTRLDKIASIVHLD